MKTFIKTMQWIKHKQFTHLYYDHSQQQYRLLNADVNEWEFRHLFNDWELILTQTL